MRFEDQEELKFQRTLLVEANKLLPIPVRDRSKIRFSLDYDDTYTKDPDMWLEFIKLLRSRGHDVLVVTMRSELDNDMDPRLLETARVIFTNGHQKLPCLQNQGIDIDIWIDDRPDYIVRRHDY